MAYIKKRGDGWQLRVTHRLLPRIFYHTFASEVEAINYGETLERLLASGIVPQELLAPGPARDDPLLSQVLTQYLANSPGVTAFDNEVIGFLLSDKPVIGLRLSKLTYRWVESYVGWLKSTERNLAPGSIRKRVGAAARAMDWHIKRTTMDNAVPMANVLRLLPRGYASYSDADEGETRKDIERDRRLTPDDVARIESALAGVKREDRERALVPDEEMTLMFRLIVDTGLRLSEAYKLQVSDIDLERGIIRLAGSKGHRGQSKPRVVPLKRPLRDLLVPWCRQRVGRLFSFWDGSPETLRATSSKLSRRFGTLFDFAKVPNFTEHDLRHEATCRWFELRRADGAWVFSEVEIAKIMGWSSTRMAIKYASLRGEDLAARLG